MSFKLKKASCVVVGAFNVYVFQPSFFAQNEIVEVGTKTTILGDFSQPGFRVSFDNYPLVWVIRPDRILVETTDLAADCGKVVATVLKTLPWTPVSAVGVNFEFQATEDEFQTMGNRQMFPNIESSYQIAQRTIHAAINDGPQVFNLSLARTDEGVNFAVNVHTDAKKLVTDEQTRTEVSALLEGVAQRFEEFRAKSIVLGREVFGLEINHANNDNKT